MLKQDVIEQLLGNQPLPPQKQIGHAYAPSNIALIKYWGKQNTELHIPMNSSVSISLGDKGATTSISIIDAPQHEIILNNRIVATNNAFYQNIKTFLQYFHKQLPYTFKIETHSTVPIAAGVASSACGFAALVKALADLFAFDLSLEQLSILARLGSGSASRSLWDGFVAWHQGDTDCGMQSVAKPLAVNWPDFMIGLWCFDKSKKSISSREGMLRTMQTSALYKAWPAMAEANFKSMCEYILAKNFSAVGQLAENNALMMHATMHNASPTVNYWQQASIDAMQTVWHARQQGIEIYFTMDAGPNLKCLARKQDLPQLQKLFVDVEWVLPFQSFN